MNYRVAQNVGNLLNSWGAVSLSRRLLLRAFSCSVGWLVGWLFDWFVVVRSQDSKFGSCACCWDSVHVLCMVLSRGAARHSDHQELNGISETRRRHFVAVCATLCKVLDLCNKGIKSRGMRWAGHVARVRRLQGSVGRPEGRRPLERPRR